MYTLKMTLRCVGRGLGGTSRLVITTKEISDGGASLALMSEEDRLKRIPEHWSVGSEVVFDPWDAMGFAEGQEYTLEVRRPPCRPTG